MDRGNQIQPPNDQGGVNAEEFLAFLREHDIVLEERETFKGFETDRKPVESVLHCGVRLLLSNSKKESRGSDCQEFARLLVSQAGFFMASIFHEVEKASLKIRRVLEEEERKAKETLMEAENMESDALSPVSIEKAVFPMVCGTSEPRFCPPQKRAGKVDDCLLKRIAQLERALTYASLQGKKSSIEQVVSYAALCMSMVDGSSLGSVIINLNPDMFPYLMKLQKKGNSVYLFRQNSRILNIHRHLNRILQRMDQLEKKLKTMKYMLAMEVVVLVAWMFSCAWVFYW